MKLLPLPLLFSVSSLLALSLAGQAQISVHAGPSVGVNTSKVHFPKSQSTADIEYRTGLDIGVIGEIGVGHFALQPALRYSQKGHILRDEVDYRSGPNTPIGRGQLKSSVRLHYVVIPLNLVFRQQTNGQGFRVFAGPYAALLLGGHNQTKLTAQGEETLLADDKIRPVTTDAPAPANGYSFARRFDAGGQAGLGYRRGALLLQAEYSLGLRTIQPTFTLNSMPVRSPDYYNRAFQVSLAYLFGGGE